jgi:hypothetical protein
MRELDIYMATKKVGLTGKMESEKAARKSLKNSQKLNLATYHRRGDNTSS